MDRKDLEGQSREDLIRAAEARGIARARSLTIPELVDAILAADAAPARQKGWLGRARDLLTSVIDRGMVGGPEPRIGRRASSAPPPLPTVTLAEIYAAQGHLERALTTLEEVIAREPEHPEAARLHARFSEQLLRVKPSVPPPAIEIRPEPIAPPLAPLPAIEDASTSETDADALEAEGAAAEEDEPAEQALTAAEAASADAVAADEPVVDLAFEPPVEVDEIVGLAVDPTTVYLYWEVRPQTLAEARARAADGAVTVRVLGVTPAPGGPAIDSRDIRVDALSGELFVKGLPPATEVRVSVGYKSGDRFEPFAVGLELSTPRAAIASDVTTVFRRYSDAAIAGDLAPVPRRPTHSVEVAAGSPPTAARDHDDAAVRFPAGVWVDPRTRVVRVVDEARVEGTVRGELSTRLPGSSEIFRKTAVWSQFGRAL